MNRREFLKGVTALALLSPLASLKAMGLNEVKKYKLGELGNLDLRGTVERGAICTWCSVGCGMIFYVKDGKPIFVEGDPDNPLNKGKLCVKGVASLALFGHKNELRLRKPLIRVNEKPPFKEIIERRDADELYKLIERYKPVWKEVTWEEAFEYIAKKWKEILEEAKREGYRVYHDYDGKVCDSKKGCYFAHGKLYPIMIMAGAKLLNEEAYIIRKMSMLMGSNNIDHDARRCHSSTVAGLAATLGFGAQTQSFPDTTYISVYLILGGNPAEAHPVSMRPVLEGKERGTLKLVVVDPKFGRTAAKANIFAFHRPGTDVALLYYILHYAFYERKPPIDELPEFKKYLERLNVDEEELKYFKELVKRYTSKEVSKITGIPEDKLKKIASLFVENSGVTTNFKKFSSIEWAMGLTQHTTGVQNIRAAAIVQLALGNVGFPGGGLNPYRGHNNVQGTTDMCILAHVFPGYIKIPTNSKQIRAYQEWKLQGFPDAFNWRPSEESCKALGLRCEDGKLVVNSSALLWSWWFMNWRRFELTMGIFVGTEPEDKPWDPNSVVISDLPFFVGYNELTWQKGILIDETLKGVVIFAENPAVSDPNVRYTWAALSKAKMVVVTDVFPTETMWFADVVLPGAIQYEKEGSITNSNRWLQWSERVALPPGEAKPDLWIMKKMYEYLRYHGVITLPSEVAGKKKERVLFKHPKTGKLFKLYERRIAPYMDYENPSNQWPEYKEIDPELVYREIDLAVDLYNGMYDWVMMMPLAKRRVSAPRRPDEIDGLLDSGMLTHPGGKTSLRLYKNWGWSWPKNVRILYNLWSLSEMMGVKGRWTFEKGAWVVGDLDGKTVEITGETGEMLDAKDGRWRPAFIPGHNFFLGKYYKRAWSGIADLFTGAAEPSQLIKLARPLGKILKVNDDGFEVMDVEELGIKYPILDSIYYDPEVVSKGKANFKRPYFKGTKNVDGKVVEYKPWREWIKVHDKFIKAFASCVGNDSKKYRECVKKFIVKYGEWFAIDNEGKTWAYGLDYPMHFEPSESPDLELAVKYPQIAWRKPDNRLVLFPPEGWSILEKEVALNLGELEAEMPNGAIPVVITLNRVEEHWHTGALSRNDPYLAELVPEPYAEIPVELANKIGVKSGDVIQVGSVRGRIYVRAYVTRRMPKLNINGKEVFVINVPWFFGFSGSNRSSSVANLLSTELGDIITSIQETKVFLGWVTKAPKDKYIFDYNPPRFKEEELGRW